MVFGYLFLAQMTTNPPNNSKSMFQHSFRLLHSWSHLRQTNRHTYQWGEHIRTQNMGKMLHFMVFGYLFLALADTNPPTNLKSMFQHSFPLLHSWFRLRQTNQYTYQWGSLQINPLASQHWTRKDLCYIPTTCLLDTTWHYRTYQNLQELTPLYLHTGSF